MFHKLLWTSMELVDRVLYLLLEMNSLARDSCKDVVIRVFLISYLRILLCLTKSIFLFLVFLVFLVFLLFLKTPAVLVSLLQTMR
jgi:hypothetical protein